MFWHTICGQNFMTWNFFLGTTAMIKTLKLYFETKSPISIFNRWYPCFSSKHLEYKGNFVQILCNCRHYTIVLKKKMYLNSHHTVASWSWPLDSEVPLIVHKEYKVNTILTIFTRNFIFVWKTCFVWPHVLNHWTLRYLWQFERILSEH